MEEFKNQIVKILQDSNYVESEGEWVRKRSIQTPGQVIVINGQQMNQPGRTIEVIDKCDMWEGEIRKKCIGSRTYAAGKRSSQQLPGKESAQSIEKCSVPDHAASCDSDCIPGLYARRRYLLRVHHLAGI